MFASRPLTAMVGPGCGGSMPCRQLSAAIAGMRIFRYHIFGRPAATSRRKCDAVDDGHEDDEPDLEEHRDADEESHRRHHPGGGARRTVVDHEVGDASDGTGVGEQSAEHGAEEDDQARLAQGASGTVDEGFGDVRQRQPRRHGSEEGDDREGEERVQFRTPVDQEDQQDDRYSQNPNQISW
jgi:hypothetical protein